MANITVCCEHPFGFHRLGDLCSVCDDHHAVVLADDSEDADA